MRFFLLARVIFSGIRLDIHRVNHAGLRLAVDKIYKDYMDEVLQRWMEDIGWYCGRFDSMYAKYDVRLKYRREMCERELRNRFCE
jgi:hypothetical protein